MPESQRRKKVRRDRHSPNRARRTAAGPAFNGGPTWEGSRPRIRPRTWRRIRRWGLYSALLIFALAIIGSFVVQAFPGGGGGGSGDTGSGDAVGQRVNTMPNIYPPSNHIIRGETFEGAYNSNPPTSGPHWDVGWAECGFFNEELPDEQVVHNMEHGQVIISYNLTDDAQIDQVKAIANSLPGRRSWMVARPYSQIAAGQVAVTSWGWMDKFPIGELTEERVESFYEAHRNRSGIESIPCGGFMS